VGILGRVQRASEAAVGILGSVHIEYEPAKGLTPACLYNRAVSS
jgi:hypothetical protein